MTANPDVSVVISCKNRQAMLWDCFLGLGAQTLPRDRFEVVLMDNVSRDDLAGVAERARRELGLAVTFTRMDEDHGPAPARNRGVGIARAPIIAFTDSDCRPEPGWLEAGIAAFADPAIALVTGPVLPKPGQPVRATSKLTFVVETEHASFPNANAFYRRAVFLAFGGFDATLSFDDPFGRSTECADTDLAWRIIKAGHARRFMPDAVIRHEIEQLSVFNWLIEPTRVFALPELVRRHPELRAELLTWGIFFYPSGTLRVVATLLWLLACAFVPWLLLLGPLGLLAIALRPRRGPQAGDLGQRLLKAGGDILRQFALTASLLYGSARFRSLVL
ncbi:glycosyltransferase [Roseomonas sp. HJA6]|uniref:Glycosyltransferase n=1 Tax=Roseomonas alba TaxID=2846776 RepID=A0ABS7A6K1_9PROT|nr:glycosyltransferase [Neoroseomonas alba]MBW6396784.1 glycosyltransferase [Neoroseomonas alba]